MKKEFSTSIKNQFRSFSFGLFLISVILVMEIYMRNGSPFYKNFEFTIWPFFILIFPTLVLHIEYFFANKSSKFVIDYENESIEYLKGDTLLKYPFSEISRIVVYLAPSIKRGSSVKYLPFEKYNFAKFFFKGGDEMIITSLLIGNLDQEIDNFKGPEIIKKSRLFASIWLEK
jgi:hypothetical protein